MLIDVRYENDDVTSYFHSNRMFDLLTFDTKTHLMLNFHSHRMFDLPTFDTKTHLMLITTICASGGIFV